MIFTVIRTFSAVFHEGIDFLRQVSYMYLVVFVKSLCLWCGEFVRILAEFSKCSLLASLPVCMHHKCQIAGGAPCRRHCLKFAI